MNYASREYEHEADRREALRVKLPRFHALIEDLWTVSETTQDSELECFIVALSAEVELGHEITPEEDSILRQKYGLEAK